MNLYDFFRLMILIILLIIEQTFIYLSGGNYQLLKYGDKKEELKYQDKVKGMF